MLPLEVNKVVHNHTKTTTLLKSKVQHFFGALKLFCEYIYLFFAFSHLEFLMSASNVSLLYCTCKIHKRFDKDKNIWQNLNKYIKPPIQYSTIKNKQIYINRTTLEADLIPVHDRSGNKRILLCTVADISRGACFMAREPLPFVRGISYCAGRDAIS